MTNLKEEPLLTTAEAAEALGISAGAVRQMVHSGRLVPKVRGRPGIVRFEDGEAVRSPNLFREADVDALRGRRGRGRPGKAPGIVSGCVKGSSKGKRGRKGRKRGHGSGMQT